MAKDKRIETFRHDGDSRTNIPTEELRDFVKESEETPSTLLYPRDPSLDPQLVWKGKDEQDREALEVPVVPIYIQEKIHPQALIEDLRTALTPGPSPNVGEGGEIYDQIDFFGDFNGIEEFAEKIDFYQHEQHWSNRMILGDSLLVMTSLAEKEGLKGKVQTIYLDPPYGIKFGSNWQVSTRKRDVKDGSAESATRQPEQVKAFRDTWELGIHSYLSYLRDRLTVARELLTETGSIFVQIGDENVHLVRSVMDEVFGSENFHAQINFKSTSALGQSGLAQAYDYIIWYAKDLSSMKFRNIFREREISGDREWRFVDDQRAERGFRRIDDNEFNRLATYDGVFRRSKLTSSGFTPSCTFEFDLDGTICRPYGNKSWLTNTKGIDNLKSVNRLFLIGSSPYFKQYFYDFPVTNLDNSWTDQPGAEARTYVVQTADKFVQRCILMTTDPGDLVLDPTCGSGTTAHVAEQWGRRWITIDTSRVALALARTRLMAGRFPYYLLADSEAGAEKERGLGGNPFVPSADRPLSQPLPSAEGRGAGLLSPAAGGKVGKGGKGGDIRKGFVYKRVPHVTLKSIANNPDIREGMTREEIDAAIARHADQEVLYDQPYEDKQVVRVTGPFTVESLSPHRVLATSDEDYDGTVSEEEAQRQQDFATMILENLKANGAHNTKKGETLKFDRLEPFASQWIAAKGEYSDSYGAIKRVAVSIGPEHGTVGAFQVQQAAIEAMKGIPANVLLVCGFAFDAAVSEEAAEYGNLTVLPVKMNPDLAMGDDLLKKTGSGNLFMIFGEPDIDIRTEGESVVVEIRGVDVYDPTTGEVRSSSTDDIACWFIDTDYNAESFFVRHAYFTGADEPYDKLKRALRAEIDEGAWSSLYSTVSRPFGRPESGKIAVKVINHYGDEVMKVYEV